MEAAIDFQIVAACNELIELQSKTTNDKVDNRNERGRLQREMEQQKRGIDAKLRNMRHTKDLSVYREECSKVFEEAGIPVPGLAEARQAQLCLHVHLITIYDNQLDLLDRQHQKERDALQLEKKRVRERTAEREIQLLNEIVRLQNEVQELQEKMDKPFQPRKKEVKDEHEQASSQGHQQQQQQHKHEQQEQDQQTPKQPEPSKHIRSESSGSVESGGTAISTPPSSPKLSFSLPAKPQQRETVMERHQRVMERRGSAPMFGLGDKQAAAITTTTTTTESTPLPPSNTKMERRGSAPMFRGSFWVPARPKHLFMTGAPAVTTSAKVVGV